jgi:hypothetical protein
MHVKPTNRRSDHGQILLELPCHAGLGHLATAVGTIPRQRHVDRLVDLRRRRPMGVSTVPSPDTTARRVRVTRRRPLGKGSRLPFARALRRLECTGQPLNLTAEAVALSFKLRVLFPQALVCPFPFRNLLAQTLSALPQLIGVARIIAVEETIWHTAVMPDRL